MTNKHTNLHLVETGHDFHYTKWLRIGDTELLLVDVFQTALCDI